MLGVEPNEEFKLQYKSKQVGQCKYSLTNNLILNIYYNNIWQLCRKDKIFEILNGTLQIVQIPKITPEDKIVIDYAKLCGYKWLAKDEDKRIFAYKTKPLKGKEIGWSRFNNFDFVYIGYPISFLSWDDDEPYFIEE